MTFTEEYWIPVRERYCLSGNLDLRNLINNIAYPYNLDELDKYQNEVSEADQKKDKEIIRLIKKIKTDCAGVDAGKIKYSPQMRTDYDKLMRLMDERGWKKIPNNQPTPVMQQRRVKK